MIHRVKTVTWEVRSHNFISVLSADGQVTSRVDLISESKSSKVYLKRLARHIGEVVKCIHRIEKEKQVRKEKANEDLSDKK